MIIYNFNDVAFPLCGFIDEDRRKMLIDIFTKQKTYGNDITISYEISENYFCEMQVKEVLDALNRPFDIDVSNIPAEILPFDPATAIAEREGWVIKVDGQDDYRQTTVEEYKEITGNDDYYV